MIANFLAWQQRMLNRYPALTQTVDTKPVGWFLGMCMLAPNLTLLVVALGHGLRVHSIALALNAISFCFVVLYHRGKRSAAPIVLLIVLSLLIPFVVRSFQLATYVSIGTGLLIAVLSGRLFRRPKDQNSL